MCTQGEGMGLEEGGGGWNWARTADKQHLIRHDNHHNHNYKAFQLIVGQAPSRRAQILVLEPACTNIRPDCTQGVCAGRAATIDAGTRQTNSSYYRTRKP